MASHARTSETARLEAEVQELRRELVEARETLDAIRRGAVDAVVVERPDGPTVYTLTGADEPYRVMVEEMQEGAVALHADGLIAYCNKQAARILRTTPQGLLGRSIHDFLAAESLPVFEALLRNNGEGGRGEVTLAAADGTQVPALLAARVLSMDETPLVSVLIADLTEQKRHQEMAASEAFSRAVLDQAVDAVVVCDESGQIIRANQAAHALCETNPLFEPFRSAFPLLHGATPDPAVSVSGRPEEPLCLFPWVWTSRFLRGVEVVLPCATGPRNLLLNVGPLRDASRKPRGCIVTMTDITRHKQMEESLRATVERVGLLSKVASRLLAAQQPQQTIETLCRKIMAHLDCHVFFNFLVDDRAERLHLNAWAGIPDEAVKDVEWIDLATTICGRSVQEVRPAVVENVPDAEDPRVSHVRPFGVKAYACHPLVNEGRAIGTLSFGSRTKLAFTPDELSLMKTVSDHVALAIQRVRLLELAQQRATEAQVASEAKSRFLAHISHELRTPMNAILGMIDLALRKAVNPTAIDCLVTAKESADLLLALLNDLLDSAKIESGKLELEAAPFSLRGALDQVTRVLSVRANEKGLGFHCHLADDVPDAVVGDKLRLRQVLLNLAGNAVKFTERGEVVVSVRVVEGLGIGDWGLEDQKHPASPDSPSPIPNPQSPIPSVTLEFAVRDTGVGISQDVLLRIFKPFAQADVSTARRFGGTGLGLSISASLVALMGGCIWAESEPGQGSTFRFTVSLPLAKELPVQQETTVELHAAPATTLRILLVEDNAANQKFAAYVLRDRGHVVDTAADGPQALRMVDENHYDVILMDIQMPGMDGMEATAAIRAREGGRRHVPIIAMTAYAMKEDREQCLSNGMDGYLSKPLDPREMIAMVEGLAASAPPAAPAAPDAPAVPAAPAATAETLSPQAVFDHAAALERCAHNERMLAEMIRYFLQEADEVFPQMRAALEQGDRREVGRLGHRLKGTVVYLGAERAAKATTAVERAAHADGTARVQDAIAALERECRTLAQAVAASRPASPT